METHRKLLYELIAGDLMSRNLVTVCEGMPLRDAAQLLIRASVHGVPVTDAGGRCVGVLSMTDVARWGVKRATPQTPPPVACTFQERHQGRGGQTTILCRLPPGACSLQGRQAVPGGWADTVCRDPHGVPTDWQVVELDVLPVEDVRHFMTADPVTVHEGADVRTIARLMTDALVHRVIVVDGERRPVGVVSGTDLIAALVRAPAPAGADLCMPAGSSTTARPPV